MNALRGLIAGSGLLLVAAPALSQDVTFTKDIVPIFQASCQSCHRPGSIAPMSLLTYDDARPWVRSIRTQVTRHAMPPWYIDKNVGIQEFKDDRSLSDKEVATIVNWIDAGAPRGNPSDMPPARAFSDNLYEWTLAKGLGREPDLIVPIPKPFTVKAGTPNWWIDMVSDMGLKEDRWIKAYETKPSLEGFPIVHHATTSMVKLNGEEEGLSEYALGKTGDIHPDGSARLVKSGTQIKWNMHYSSKKNGEDTTDRTQIAFWFYPRDYKPEHQLVRRSVGSVTDLDFPPGDNNVRTDGYTILDENVRLTVYQPHLHNLGKRQCFEAIFKDGRVQTLSCVNWDFGWHIAYNYADGVQPLLPKGTVLHIISWHDNSRGNRWAADPKNWVGWGNRSTDDMSFAHISWFALTDQEYQSQLRERLAARSTNNQQQ